MPGARFSLCRYHLNGGDRVGGRQVPPEWGNRRGIGRLLERHPPLRAVILFACVGVGLGYILFIGDGVGPEGDARGGR